MTRTLLKSVSVVSSMTLLSRVLGFVRDILFARLGGAAPFMDAFFIAFKIPNFLRRLFAEGAFSQSFVPVLGEYKETKTHEETRELVARVTGTLGAVLLVVTAIGVVAAPVLVFIFAPGFWADGERHGLATEMLRWTFPYILFISLTALAGGVLNTWGRFGVPALTPVFLNLALIGAALYIAPYTENPGLGLAVGVFVAGIVQLAFQLPFLARIRMLPRPKLRGGHEGVRKIMKLMLPAIFGSSVAQINLLFDTLIASFLVAGSVSWLYYSDRLVEFPLGLFGIALATVILPRLSGQHASHSADAFAATLDWSLRWVWLISLPAATGLFVLAGPLMATLFQHGEFGAVDTSMARLSLMAYAFGLVGFALVKVLAPGFFARQDTKTPVKIGIIALLSNMALNVVIVVPWVMLGHTGPHAGLALATSIAAFINATLLYRGLKREGAMRMGAGWNPFITRVVVASVGMALVVAWFAGPLDAWQTMAVADRVLRLAAAVALGGAAYGALLLAAGMRPAALRIAP
ncbi:MAG: murein biosynthesis integral membrane protein MurJ [Gammaproteobacteria bacterium]